MNFFEKMIEVAKSMGVKNFAYYKKWALDHLKKQLEEDESVTKAIEYCEEYMEKAYGVGTIRTWKGKKYIKGPDKKWRRYFDKHDRGANQAIKNIMREINSLENGDVEGLYAIIQKNAGRFRDENGNVLPEVQQIHDLAEKKQSESEKEEKKNSFSRISSDKQLLNSIDRKRNKLSSPGKDVTPIEEELKNVSEKLKNMNNKELNDVFDNFETDYTKYSSIGEFEDELEERLKTFDMVYDRLSNNNKKEELESQKEHEQKKKLEFEKKQNRSNAMKGNQNAKKDGVSDEDEKEEVFDYDGEKLSAKELYEREYDYYKNNISKDDDFNLMKTDIKKVRNSAERSSNDKAKRKTLIGLKAKENVIKEIESGNKENKKGESEARTTVPNGSAHQSSPNDNKITQWLTGDNEKTNNKHDKDKYSIKKSFLEQIEEISKSIKSGQKHDLEYYKKWAMSILDKQEETVDEPNEDTVVKALEYCETMMKSGYPVGTIREWKGQKYIKIAPNKWKPKYDNMGSRGAKMSLTNLKKAVAKCNSEEELFNLINSNASRFRDENGNPFPEVQELHDMVNKRSNEIKGKKNAETLDKIQKFGKKAENTTDKLGNGNVEGVAEDAGDDTVNAIKNGSKKKQQNENNVEEDETKSDKDIEKMEALNEDIKNGGIVSTEIKEEKKPVAAQNVLTPSDLEGDSENETFESLTEKFNATKDPDEREKILNKITSLEKEKSDTIKDMKEETYEDMGYSEKTKEEIDNMDRAEFSEYMRREQKSIPMDKIGRGGGRITNFDNAYNVCKKIAETYGVSDEGVKKLQDFMTYNTDTASRLHDELNEKMGMSYELLDADYDMAYKNALKQLLGKKTNGDSDKEKAAVDKYHNNLGAAARKYL